MEVKKKSMQKFPTWVILVAVMVLLIGGVAAIPLIDAFQKAPVENQFDEEKIRVYLASNDLVDNGIIMEEADAWIREFLNSEERGSVEINRTMKIKKGYAVSGNKTITGKGTFLAENSGGGNIFSVSENSSLCVEGIHVDCNYNMNVGVNVKANATLSWKGGSIDRAMDYGIFTSGDVEVAESSFEDCGVWIELRSGAKADVKDTEFYKCGTGGIIVAKGAECHITGEKTLIEQSGKEAVKNEGTFSMTDGNIYMTNGYGIDNFGTANLTGVKQNRSVQGGLVLNEIGATANLKDCILWNNIYHVRNYGELNMEDCQLDTATGSSILNEAEGTVNIKSVSVKNGNNYAIYNRNGVANVKDLECELILNTGIVNIGEGIVKVDGYSINYCQMGIENRASDEYGYGEIHANNVTVKNAGNRNIFSWGGVCNISNSTLYPSEGYSVYIRGGSAILDSVKILGTIKETSGGLAVGSTIYRDPVVTIKGDTEITGCASRGIINYNKLTIYDCDIHDNNTSGTLGSGVGIYSVGDVYMYGGKIHDNYGTKYGAGVRLDRNDDAGLVGNMYMYGGSIYDNEAGISGGGVSIGQKSVFEMHGGSIYNNLGATRGDGMVVSGTFNLYDAERLGDNDIYLTAGNTINVKSDKLSFNLAKISLESYSTLKDVVVFPSKVTAEKLCDKFTTKNHQFDIVQEKKAGILVHNRADFDTSYDFSKAQVVTVTTFEQLKAAVESTKSNESKVIAIAADIVMADTITLPQRTNIKITDNGTARKLVRGTDKNLFMIGRVSHLVLGGNAGIVIDGDALNGKEAKTSLVCVSNFGYFVLEDGGALQNAFNMGTSTDSGVRGAAVNVAMDGYFIMNGGTITNCSSPDDEKYSDKYCAIYGSASCGISIKGGTITNCNDRAILSYNHVYMSEGKIENCQHMMSGGGAIRTPMFVMTGGIIQNCLSTNAGSAVYIVPGSHPQGYFKLDGGTITGNQNGTTISTSVFGGAIYIKENAVFDFESGIVSNNVAGDKEYRMACSAILNDGEVHIGKDAVITGNVATLSPGAIYNRDTGTMTIKGAKITENTSTNVRWEKDNTRYGAAAAIQNEGTLIIDGAKVTDNHVGTYGTIYSKAGSTTLKNMTFIGNESGANGTITDDYGNELGQNNKGVDFAVGVDTESVTLSGQIIAEETDEAFRLNLDETFNLAKDFSTNSKIKLYLHGDIYVGRPVLEGNITPDTVACFTWTNTKEGYYLAEDGYIRANKTEAVIGDVPYVTLEEAVAAAKDGDTIMLLTDVSLAGQLKIDKSITITTDGKANRTIYCGAEAANKNVIAINASDKHVILKGTKETQLILDGNSKAESPVTLTGAFVRVEEGDNQQVTIEYVTIQNITSSSQYGVAISTTRPIEVKHCNFIECQSTNSKAYGGAIYISKAGAGTKFIGCEFTACTTAGIGGAIYTKGSDLTVEGCHFTNCVSTGTSVDSTKNNNGGGALYAYEKLVGLKLINSTFKGNSSAWRGGAIHSRSALTITNCTFGDKDNFADGKNTSSNAGGAIHMNGGVTLDITDTSFYGNKATGNFGGAISFSTATSTLNLSGTCVFQNNTALGSSSYKGGGAIFAPVNFNIKEGAWIEMSGNECTGYASGDAICVNAGAVADAKFVVEKDAALYVYNNPSETDADNDICIKNGTALSPTINDGGNYGAWKPVAKIGNVGYQTLQSAVDAVEDGGTIPLIHDVILTSQLSISKSVTITTDGKVHRVIYCGSGAASNNVIKVNAPSKRIIFKGASENSQIIFDGNSENNVTFSGAFIRIESAEEQTVKLQQVTMRNINSTSGWGTAVSAVKPFEADHCTFIGCQSTNDGNLGGAIYTSAGAAGTKFTYCQFDDCSSNYRGGAIYTKGAITVEDSQFTRCSATNRGGAIYSEKGMNITRCIFGDEADITNGGNTAGNAGGAILVQHENTLNIQDSTFVGNKAEGNFGGAVAFSTDSSTLNLSGTCVFRNNTAAGSSNYKGGGAIFAPVNFNIKEGAWIEMSGNECTGYASGDAICINAGAVANVKFVIEKDAALYVYDNPSVTDADNDICIKNGTAFLPTVKEDAIYSTSIPEVTE